MPPKATNVVEWVNRGPDDIVLTVSKEDLRYGTQLVVKEFETAIFLRDGKLYDVFLPGRHSLSTLNLPLITRILRIAGGYGESPFKAQVVFVSLKQHRGRFGVNMRVRMSERSTWMTELQSFGDYYFRIEDPTLFLTQIVGGVQQLSSEDVSTFIRNFLMQQTMQNFSQSNVITIYGNLNNVTPKIRATLAEEFKMRGIELLNLQFGGVSFPLLEKMEKEDPTYGLPLIAAIQSGSEDKVLEITKVVESMRGLGKSSGAAFGAGFVAVPYMFGQPAQQAQAPQQPQQAPPPSKGDLVSKLKELKEALDDGLITKEEYEVTKTELMAKWKKDG